MDNEASSSTSKPSEGARRKTPRRPDIKRYCPPKGRRKQSDPSKSKEAFPQITSFYFFREHAIDRNMRLILSNEKHNCYTCKSLDRHGGEQLKTLYYRALEKDRLITDDDQHDNDDDFVREPQIGTKIKIEVKDYKLISDEGKPVLISSELLKATCMYFKAAAAKTFCDSELSEFDIGMRKDVLETVVEFLESGNIIMRMEDFEEIFAFSDFFDCPCLREICKRFLCESVLCNPVAVVENGFGFMENCKDIVPLIECAVCILGADLAKNTEELCAIENVECLAYILGRNCINVPNEDDVANFVLKLFEVRKKSHDDFRKLSESIRFVHMSVNGFEAFKGAVKRLGIKDIPFLDLIDSERFLDLPVSQLRRRANYMAHIHAIWSESNTDDKVFRAVNFKETSFVTTCISIYEDRKTCTVLSRCPDFRESNEHLRIVPVLNKLFLVTCSPRPRKGIIYQQNSQDGTWTEFVRFRIDHGIPRITPFSCNRVLFVADFKGFFEPMNLHRFVPCVDTTETMLDFPVVERVELPPDKIHMDDKFLITLKMWEVCIWNMDTDEGKIFTIDRKDPIAKLHSFTDFLKVGNSVYIFEDIRAACSASGSCILQEKMHLYDLNTKEEETIVLPHIARNPRPRSSEPVQLMMWNHTILVLKPSDCSENFIINEFIPGPNDIRFLAEFPLTKRTPTEKYVRVIRAFVPYFINPCENCTVLSRYCGTLDSVEMESHMAALRPFL